jgi:hypothetical protein
MATKPKAVETPTRVIKRGTCPTVSGKSEITYQLGSDADDRLVLRIHSNDGGGYFSNEWILVANILEALEEWPADKPITSVAVSKLFRGKSVNSSAFLLAALKAEGVLSAIEKKQRCHELGDVEAFLAQVRALQSGKPAPKKKATAKAPTQKKAAAKSKKKSA